jgi:hypothetical protein
MRRTGFLAAILATATFALAPLGASAAPSRTVTVCPSGPPLCDFATIPAALAAVSDGDTISVAPGIYAGGFTIDKSISVVGFGAGSTTISGGDPAAVTISWGKTVQIRGFTISGADQTGLINSGTLLLVDSTVSHNQDEPGYGGPGAAGIYNGGSLTMRSSTVDDNGPGRGGVGGILNDGWMILEDSSVVDNDSSVGGILNHGSATLRRTVVARNGEWSAGGIVNSGKLVLIKCSLFRNWSDHIGALQNDGEATIIDTTILRNFTLIGNSGIANRGTLHISRSTISNNVSGSGNVGGLLNIGGAVAITDSVLRSNYGHWGGGIVTVGGTLALERSLVLFNRIGDYLSHPGAGIRNEHSEMTLSKTIVFGNDPDNCYGCPEGWNGSFSPFRPPLETRGTLRGSEPLTRISADGR